MSYVEESVKELKRKDHQRYLGGLDIFKIYRSRTAGYCGVY